MFYLRCLAVLSVLLAGAATAQEKPPLAHVTTLFEKDLADYPGKQGVLILVEYPPGGADPIHRHDAHGFIFVLEGAIVMGVKGGKPVTLKAGQVFYEGPHDIHDIGRNASGTEPAKFLVFLIKKKDAPILVPVE